MFLHNYWYVAATPSELDDDTLLGRWVLNEPVLLFRTSDGGITAMRDICPHRSARLSSGERDGDTVRCLYHGLEFGPDGTCIKVPGQGGTPPSGLRVETYHAVEKWRLVWIWMGDPAAADERKIPDFHWNDDPDWFPVGDYMHLDCHYQLLSDNLMDLSHEAYVHRGTIGTDAVSETPATASRDGDHVTVERIMPECPAPPFYKKLKGYDGLIDRMHRIHFDPPSTIMIESKSMPSNSSKQDDGLEYRVLCAITPESDTSTHFFWSVPRNFNPEEAVTEMMYQGSKAVFEEDIDVLSRQQEVLNRVASQAEWQNIHSDAGAVYARRVVEERLSAEAPPK
ncbi:MAG: aromatic ring-hydroxylating dioxygenase subunit alpha [Pseudomonadota bacterium]|nr:aromatic ring-hydroxylating dioxygenase subunit alpha [Pseudomonadota bacterium]